MLLPLHDNNPTRTLPVVTVGFIIINTLAFLFQFSLGPDRGQQFVLQLGIIPWEISHLHNHPESSAIPPIASLFTAMFLHGGWMHLIGNMLYLWIFGNNIEDAMGHFRFVIFYSLTGLAASFTHIMIGPDSTVPMIGASGAISGVLGGYLVLYPRAEVSTLLFLGWYIRLIEIPALVVLGFWFALQVFEGFLSLGIGGGVAWFAHIGGFLAGIILVKIFEKRTPNKHPDSGMFPD